MRNGGKTLFKLFRCATHFSYLSRLDAPTLPKATSLRMSFQAFRPLSSSSSSSTTTTTVENDKKASKPDNRDTILLEKFRLRKLKGSSKSPQKSSSLEESEDEMQRKSGPATAVSGFKDLGLSDEVVEAVEEMGFLNPCDVQCVGIPALLDGKSVILGSFSGVPRTLAYLLPFVQLLKEDEKRYGTKSKHPRALVLCTTEELSDEVFRMAKFISQYAQLKSVKETSTEKLNLKEDEPDVSIGMLIGTPDEVFQLIEEGNVGPDEIKYLILDEVDIMFDLGFAPDIKRILSSLKSASRLNNNKLQAVLVTSRLIKMLHELFLPLVESLERDNAGEIAAMMLEMDDQEVFHLIESPDALELKIADAIDSLHASK